MYAVNRNVRGVEGKARVDSDATSRDSSGDLSADEGGLSVWRQRAFLVMCAGVIALKCFLVPCYHSTDFEVHRNWMALTAQLPLEKWYYENTSEWTLDYPPFFAYFEFLLSQIAYFVVPSALVLRKEPYFSSGLLIFHRLSVIATDLLFLVSSAVIADQTRAGGGRKACRRALALCALLVCNASLIMIDNIHFQYNSFLTSILLLSVVFINGRRWLLGAFCFCVLLNAKHIYLYYAAAYAVFYWRIYLFSSVDASVVVRAAKLAVAVAIPFVLSFGPLVYCAGPTVLPQILGRLFPFQRGLTHAYWAPNIWALYNVADFSLFHGLKFLRKLPTSALPPQYTSGLVQEYSHSVLPNVTPLAALLLTLLLLCPLILFFRGSRSSSRFPLLLTHSAFAFFMAGYHVHEKAVVLVSVPYTLLAVNDHRFLSSFVVVSSIANISLFPLFFAPFENMIKVVLAILYHILCEFIMRFLCERNPSLGLLRKTYLRGLLLVQLYCMVIHPATLADRFEFLPLMLTSVSCAVGVAVCFGELVWMGYCEGPVCCVTEPKQKTS